MDYEFWKDIFTDHAKFFHLLLIDEDLKDEFYKLWQSFTNINPTRNLQQFDILVDRLERAKKEVLENLLRVNIVGFLFPSFVEHTIKEVTFYKRLKEDKGLTVSDLKFWLEHDKEALEVTQKFIDPKNLSAANEVLKDVNKFVKLIKILEQTQNQKILQESIYALAQFGEKSDKLKSDILSGKVSVMVPIEFLEHEAKENAYGKKLLAAYA